MRSKNTPTNKQKPQNSKQVLCFYFILFYFDCCVADEQKHKIHGEKRGEILPHLIFRVPSLRTPQRGHAPQHRLGPTDSVQRAEGELPWPARDPRSGRSCTRRENSVNPEQGHPAPVRLPICQLQYALRQPSSEESWLLLFRLLYCPTRARDEVTTSSRNLRDLGSARKPRAAGPRQEASRCKARTSSCSPPGGSGSRLAARGSLLALALALALGLTADPVAAGPGLQGPHSQQGDQQPARTLIGLALSRPALLLASSDVWAGSRLAGADLERPSCRGHGGVACGVLCQ